jgi:hypothetical protein
MRASALQFPFDKRNKTGGGAAPLLQWRRPRHPCRDWNARIVEKDRVPRIRRKRPLP